MGNGFQTVYFFCKELHLRSYRVPRNSFSQTAFSGTNRFIISLINLGLFGIRKSTIGKVALLGVVLRF